MESQQEERAEREITPDADLIIDEDNLLPYDGELKGPAEAQMTILPEAQPHPDAHAQMTDLPDAQMTDCSAAHVQMTPDNKTETVDSDRVDISDAIISNAHLPNQDVTAGFQTGSSEAHQDSAGALDKSNGHNETGYQMGPPDTNAQLVSQHSPEDGFDSQVQDKNKIEDTQMEASAVLSTESSMAPELQNPEVAPFVQEVQNHTQMALAPDVVPDVQPPEGDNINVRDDSPTTSEQPDTDKQKSIESGYATEDVDAGISQQEPPLVIAEPVIASPQILEETVSFSTLEQAEIRHSLERQQHSTWEQTSPEQCITSTTSPMRASEESPITTSQSSVPPGNAAVLRQTQVPDDQVDQPSPGSGTQSDTLPTTPERPFSSASNPFRSETPEHNEDAIVTYTRHFSSTIEEDEAVTMHLDEIVTIATVSTSRPPEDTFPFPWGPFTLFISTVSFIGTATEIDPTVFVLVVFVSSLLYMLAMTFMPQLSKE